MNTKKIGNIAVLSAAAASIALTGCGEAKKIDKYFEQGEYEEAVDAFERLGLNDKEKTKLSGLLKSRLDNAISDYAAGEIKYDKAADIIKSVCEIDLDALEDEGAEASVLLKKLKTSKDSYEEGIKYYEEENYSLAYRFLSQVIEEDTKNYSKAEDKCQKSKTELCKHVNEQVEAYVADERYSDALKYLENINREFEIDELSSLQNKIKGDYKKSIFDKAEAYAAENNYIYAVLVLENAYNSQTFANDQKEFSDAIAKMQERGEFYSFTVDRDNLFDRADKYLAEHIKEDMSQYEKVLKYQESFKALSAELSYFNGYYIGLNLPAEKYYEYAEKDPEYQRMYNEYVNSFVKSVKELCEAYVKQGSCKAAEYLLSQIDLGSFGLESYAEEISKKAPLYLVDCTDNLDNNAVLKPEGNTVITVDNEYLPANTIISMTGVDGEGWGNDTNPSLSLNITEEGLKSLNGKIETDRPEKAEEIDEATKKAVQKKIKEAVEKAVGEFLEENTLCEENESVEITVLGGEVSGDIDDDLKYDISGLLGELEDGVNRYSFSISSSGEVTEGEITEPEEEEEAVAKASFEIKGVKDDEEVVLYTEELVQGFAAKDVEIDIEGVSEIKFELTMTEDGRLTVYLPNWTVSK